MSTFILIVVIIGVIIAYFVISSNKTKALKIEAQRLYQEKIKIISEQEAEKKANSPAGKLLRKIEEIPYSNWSFETIPDKHLPSVSDQHNLVDEDRTDPNYQVLPIECIKTVVDENIEILITRQYIEHHWSIDDDDTYPDNGFQYFVEYHAFIDNVCIAQDHTVTTKYRDYIQKIYYSSTTSIKQSSKYPNVAKGKPNTIWSYCDSVIDSIEAPMRQEAQQNVNNVQDKMAKW